MDFDTHEEWAREECHFIAERLQEHGLLNVMRLLLSLGEEHLQRFASDRSEAVQDYFHTPREDRERFLSRLREPADRALLLVCALHEARCALALLEALCKYGVTGSSGASRSTILVQSAAALQKAAPERPHLYPFAEDQPFGMTPEWFSDPRPAPAARRARR